MEWNKCHGNIIWKSVRRYSSRGVWRCCAFFIPLILLLICLATFNFYIPKINRNNQVNLARVNRHRRLVDKVVSLATSTEIVKDPILLSVIPNNSISIVLNWLCHVQDFVIPKNIILITHTNRQRDVIKIHRPEIKTFSIENDNSFHNDEENVIRTKLCALKVEIILKLMKRNLNVLVFRVDAVWFQNPMIAIERILNGDKRIDIVTTAFTGRPSALDSGLFYVKSTAESITLVNELLSILRNILHRVSIKRYYLLDNAENCFNYFSQLVYRRFGYIRYRLLPLNSFADRTWYEQSESSLESEKTDKFKELFVVRIYTDNEDNRISTQKSVMESWNHWFLDEKKKCLHDKVIELERKVWEM